MDMDVDSWKWNVNRYGFEVQWLLAISNATHTITMMYSPTQAEPNSAQLTSALLAQILADISLVQYSD